MRKQLVFTVAMGMAMLIASPTWSGDNKNGSPDEQALQARAKALIAAFNQGDAKALAEFWTPDGDYMDELGHLYKGRKAIAESFEKLFASVKGAQLRIHRTAYRLVRPDLAIADGIFEMILPNDAPPTAARYTAIQVKQDGQWFMESVREAIATPPNSTEQLEDLAWVIGDWTDEGNKGALAHLSFSWAENHNFIVMTYATTLKDVPVAGGTQWIAWDAAAKHIRSFAFDSSGSLSESVWTREGNKSVSKTKTTLRDGKIVSATNIMTRVDPDHVTWQATNRSIDGKALPDAPEVKLQRIR